MCFSFISILSERLQKRDYASLHIKKASEGCTHRRTLSFQPKPSQELRLTRFFDRVSHFIPENSIVVAETGISLWCAAETMLPKGSAFIGQVS